MTTGRTPWLSRRHLIGAGLGGGLLAARPQARTPPPAAGEGPPPRLPQPNETIDLWPGGPPGMPANTPVETVTERSTDPFVIDRAVHGIARPRMAAFRPTRPNGAAVLLTPGGGYRRVVIDKEGYEMGRWLAARGFTAFVLFYRLPGEGWAAGPNVALSDAQRAVRLIRHRAADFALIPGRLAAIGFSAGGHVCADLAVRFGARVYAPVDAADNLSARPFCAASIYTVVSMDPAIAHKGSRDLLLGANPSAALQAAHSPDRNVPADAPPHFLLHAEDDEVVPAENTIRLRAALKAEGVPVETHLFARGGHGFGLRGAADKAVTRWPELWHAWARELGLA